MAYVQYSNLDNETFRNSFVMNALSSTIAKSKSKNRLLDVGAGLAPYREHARRSGFVYQSHDFKQYIPKQSGSGLHNTEWEYPQHDFVCDILEIPYKESWDFILCTEVLEHVPDPIRAFNHLSRLLAPEGTLLITVPLISLMHQAPFWYQSGLSPFWFEYWAPKNNLQIDQLFVSGNYESFLRQELKRVSGHSVFRRILSNLLIINISRGSEVIPKELSSSAGFGTFFVGSKL